MIHFSTEPFDLILTDFDMPQMNGYHFCVRFRHNEMERLKENLDQRTVIAMLTGRGIDFEEGEKLLNMGALDSLSGKVATIETLKTFLAHMERIPLADLNIDLIQAEASNPVEEEDVDQALPESKSQLLERIKKIRDLLHDMNSPYMGVSGYLDMSLDSVENDRLRLLFKEWGTIENFSVATQSFIELGPNDLIHLEVSEIIKTIRNVESSLEHLHSLITGFSASFSVFMAKVQIENEQVRDNYLPKVSESIQRAIELIESYLSTRSPLIPDFSAVELAV